MKTKVAYIVSNVNKALAFEWIAERLNPEKIELLFIVLNPEPGKPLEAFMREKGIATHYFPLHSKKDLPGLVWKLLKLLRKEKPDVVHTHLLEACLSGLTAAWLAGVPTRIHTRHHSTFHHQYHPKMVKWDKYISRMSTDIVAISKNVQNILVKHETVHPGKIRLVHHGFELERFGSVPEVEVEGLRSKYQLGHAYPVVGVIARQIHWKGIQYIVPAFRELLLTYPDAVLVMANARGPLKAQLHEQLADVPKKNWLEIDFEENLYGLWQLFDMHVHTPINRTVEAFGQTYVEALASSIPSVFTLSGIAHEFIEHRQNALVVEHKNSDEVLEAMRKLLSDEALCEQLKTNGLESVQQFTVKQMIEALERLYLD